MNKNKKLRYIVIDEKEKVYTINTTLADAEQDLKDIVETLTPHLANCCYIIVSKQMLKPKIETITTVKSLEVENEN